MQTRIHTQTFNLRIQTQTQVREVGRLLGVPPRFISRHPFPGPGLAVRVMGDITEGNKLDCLREADEIFIECIKEYNLYDEIWQVGVYSLAYVCV